MKHKGAHKPAQSVHAPEPEPVEVHPADELAEALRGMVAAAVTAGGRDRPDVVHAQEILAKHEKPE